VTPSEQAHQEAAAPGTAGGPDGRVHCAGLVTLDLVLRTAALPSGPGKSFATGLAEIGGGPAASAAVCVARLGGAAALAGRLGEDDTGRRLTEELQREGVDTAWLRRFPGVRSPMSAVMVDEAGERSIMAFSDPRMPADAAWLTPALSGGAVLADLTWPQGALALFGRAQDAGLPRVLDADRFRHPPAIVRELVEAASHAIFSRPGLAQLTGHDGLAAGLATLAGAGPLVAVTDGADGVFWLDGATLRQQRPPPITALDTTGAGDAFHGAFALALARGQGLLPALRFATAVAAAKCTVAGGRAGLPTPAGLAAFLRHHPLPDPQ
jgi:sulfofructose kinase